MTSEMMKMVSVHCPVEETVKDDKVDESRAGIDAK